MLSLFRGNQVSLLFFLVIYTLVLRLPALLGWVAPIEGVSTTGGVLYQAIAPLLHANSVVSAWCSALLVLFQAISMNYMADEARLLPRRDWFVGVFYVWASSFLPVFQQLSPPQLAVTFLPLVLRRTFQSYRAPHATGYIFDAAFWIAVAALFYPPAIWLLLGGVIGLFVVRSFQWREQVVFASGAFTAVFLGWLFYFWRDAGFIFWQIQAKGLVATPNWRTYSQIHQLVAVGVLVFFMLLAVLNYGAYTRKKLIQIQKYVAILYWMMGLTVVAFVGILGAPLSHFALLAPSLGVFLAIQFQQMRNAFIAELLHLALVALVYCMVFLPILIR